MPPPETKTPPVVRATEGDKQSDLSKRLSRYGTAKSHTTAVLKAMGKTKALELGLRWDRIIQCGDWLRFRDYYTVGQIKLSGANFCRKHLVCSLCAIRRASRMMAAYLERFTTLRNGRPNLKAHLATLTVKNGHDLDQVLAHLLASLRLLHRRRNNHRQPSIMHNVEGGVYSVELTHDPVTGWHPHVHAIWLSEDPGMFEQASTYRLRTEWESITGDSFMCDITPVLPDPLSPADIDPHAKGFAEVFKYALKPSELGIDKLIEAYPSLVGKRLMGSFGTFRGVPEPESLADDLTAFDDLPYVEFLMHYLGGRYRLPVS
jgi:plasmid rolling circle replication initiator protein Rep